MLAIGVVAGLAGWLVALLLHSVQHLAYGYSLHAVISEESFLQGVSAATPGRRFVALMTAGGGRRGWLVCVVPLWPPFGGREGGASAPGPTYAGVGECATRHLAGGYRRDGIAVRARVGAT
ncbi:Uncharacterised protein [Edwardsiella tarda]|nr:Uncharacterised protein [Edwardsiella tarda]